ncbi:MAG: PilT/PilU family type 4a pilus ATPase [Candidatus Omnitrophica bacterium]|nr:PilT/PilU family type 4a pilus ATPase [Candidatus Omnitrophota bacterium]
MTEAPQGELKIKAYLDLAVKAQASDIHFVAGRPPILRIQGKLTPADLPPIYAPQLKEIIYEMLTPHQRAAFEERPELDFSYHDFRGYYFRVNVHREKGSVGATIRIMSGSTKSLSELGLPPVIEDLTRRHSGLVLIVGRAGSGKTTTMIHMVELINKERQAKVITIEDPIEFFYESKKGLIVQREVGSDTPSFASGLKYALRQDPDVVVIGEMRDHESISMALTTAETGHLVLATLHAPDASEAINRIIDVYSGDKQNQIRVQLAETLSAVVGQHLLPRKDSVSRVLASEILVSNLAVRTMIRRNSLSELRSQMESGREGMYTLEQCLSRLVKNGSITVETAQSHAKYPKLLEI